MSDMQQAALVLLVACVVIPLGFAMKFIAFLLDQPAEKGEDCDGDVSD